MKAFILPNSRGFDTPEFRRLRQMDPQGHTDRFQDICGPEIGRVMSCLDWHFMWESPVSVSLVSESGEPLATGYASPIQLKSTSQTTGWDGINLSYAVNSQFEGKGFGLAASCLALLEAESMWGAQAAEGAFLNIQTRSANLRSNSLIRHLTDDGEFTPADFVVKMAAGDLTAFNGARIPWRRALAIAEHHLLEMPFLQEMQKLGEIDQPEETEAFAPLHMG